MLQSAPASKKGNNPITNLWGNQGENFHPGLSEHPRRKKDEKN